MSPERAEHYIDQSRAERATIATQIAYLRKLYDGKLENEVRIRVELLTNEQVEQELAPMIVDCA